jgi:hypothetical protein
MSGYGRVSFIQLFFRSNDELAYARSRHYIGRVSNKPKFEYHPQSLESLKTLLKAQSISLTTEKATDGQIDQTKNVDLNTSEKKP